MQLRCPNCATVILARQINVEKLVAVCDECNAVFSVDPTTLPTSERKRRKVHRPEKFELTESNGELEMSYQFRDHFGWLEITMMVIIGLMNVALWAGLGMLLSEGDLGPAVFLMALSAFLMYVLTSYATNGHTISMNADKLIVREVPLRTYILDVELDTHEIVRVFTKPTGLDDNPVNDYYNVVAQMADQSERTILYYIKRQNAQFIAQMITEHLQPDNDLFENALFIDEDSNAETHEKELGEGEIMVEDVTNNTPLSLDELLHSEQEAKRRSTGQ